MLRTLLVGIDGSPGGQDALDLAIAWARRHSGTVVGMGVVDEPGIHGPEEALVGSQYFNRVNETLVADSRQRVEEWLRAAASRCEEAGVAFRPLEDVGTPYVQILKEAQRFDLVLLGRQTHFRFGWESVDDDTLARVLADCPRPIVAVPESARNSPDVLVAYDGGFPAARALAVFEASGLARDRTINLLCADTDLEQAQHHLDCAVDFLASHNLTAVPHALANFHSPAEAILDLARHLEVGLIVMGAHGKTTLRELFLGSVTSRVLKETKTPVFLYH